MCSPPEGGAPARNKLLLAGASEAQSLPSSAGHRHLHGVVRTLRTPLPVLGTWASQRGKDPWELVWVPSVGAVPAEQARPLVSMLPPW